jgi:hypothetical protein
MSRTIVLLPLLLLLGGCAASHPSQVTRKSVTEVVEFCSIQQWLALQEEVASLSSEEAGARLAKMTRHDDTFDLFYFGLLKQQVPSYDAWTEARDAFRQLREDVAVTGEQRQFAGMLEGFNQSRINWYQKYSDLQTEQENLQRQLLAAQEEKLLLEQKIKALTDIEAAISDRKEQ